MGRKDGRKEGPKAMTYERISSFLHFASTFVIRWQSALCVRPCNGLMKHHCQAQAPGRRRRRSPGDKETVPAKSVVIIFRICVSSLKIQTCLSDQRGNVMLAAALVGWLTRCLHTTDLDPCVRVIRCQTKGPNRTTSSGIKWTFGQASVAFWPR